MLLDWLDQSLAANPRARYFLQDGSQIPIEILSITSAIINAGDYNTVPSHRKSKPGLELFDKIFEYSDADCQSPIFANWLVRRGANIYRGGKTLLHCII